MDSLCAAPRTLWAVDGKTWPQAGHERMPPPLTGDPPRNWQTWEERCAAVYHWMIAQKHGKRLPVPQSKRRGLWFWREETAA